MNVILGIFSGVLLFTTLPNLFYVKDYLKGTPSEYTFFNNLVSATWLVKPILGYFSDSFHPFHYRIKSYLIIMSSMMIICCYIVSILPESITIFTIIVGLIYFSVGFVDTQAEGLTAVITKMEARITELKRVAGREQEDINSNENIGIFFMLRCMVRYCGIFAGGLLVDWGVSINIVYLILGIFPILLIIYTIFFFEEIKVRRKI